MKRVVLLALAAGAAAIAWYQASSTPRPLAQVLPGGALVYLEAKDFSRFLSDWNSSTVKQDWLNGANYAEFQRSNLFIKLNGFYKAYGAAAGFAPDLASLLSLAGDQSALALYDLQHVQFAYITRMPESKLAQTRLWLGRRSFQTRQSAGVTFYVNSAQESTVAFASASGYLLVSTNEGRMAGMLGLLAGRDTPNIAGEGWYKQSTDAAGAAGELRLAMNLESLVENTYFRSYWVQRNASDVRRFLSGVADISRTPSEIREQRVFLKRPGLTEELPSAEATAAAGSLAHLAPDDASLYRVWTSPRAADAATLVDSRIFNPRAAAEVMPRYAPGEDQTGNSGNEEDLETRIDQPPLPARGSEGPSISTSMLAQTDILGMVQVQSSKAHPTTTFVSLPCAIGLIGRTSWDADRIKDAAGGAWTTLAHGTHTFYQADGLGRVVFSVEGTLLILANDAELLQRMMDRPVATAPAFDNTNADNVTYAGFFRHVQERANYGRLMAALDFPQTQPGQQPAFFSQNIASLSLALRRVNGAGVIERAMPGRVEQRVVYSLLQLR